MKQRLHTERLVLDPFAERDLDELQSLFGLAEVRRHLMDDEIMPRAWFEDVLATSTELFTRCGYGLWAMRERIEQDQATSEGGSPDQNERPIVGFAGFREFFEPPEMQLLYGLHPGVFGRGYATEAAAALVERAIDHWGMAEVLAATDPPNVASIRVMRRLGLRYRDTLWRDGRPTLYYATDPTRYQLRARLAQLNAPPLRVLFVCTHNSARSQLGEGLLRAAWSPWVDACSAGTAPGRVHPLAQEVMAEVGMPLDGHRSKGIAAVARPTPDVVVTVCDSARESCPYVPARIVNLHHAFEDPSAIRGEEASRWAFRQRRDQMAAWLAEVVPAWIEHALASP